MLTDLERLAKLYSEIGNLSVYDDRQAVIEFSSKDVKELISARMLIWKITGYEPRGPFQEHANKRYRFRMRRKEDVFNLLVRFYIEFKESGVIKMKKMEKIKVVLDFMCLRWNAL